MADLGGGNPFEDRGEDDGFTDFDRKVYASLGKHPQFLHKDFLTYMDQRIMTNIPLIPIGQIVGFNTFAARALLRISTATTVGHAGGGASGLMQWDTEVFDSHNMHSTTTNPERITIVAPGVYLLLATLKWESNATGNRGVIFGKNATSLYQSARAAANPTAGEVSSVTVPMFDEAAAGDFYYVTAYQTSGGELDVLTNDGGLGGSSEFSIIRLSN